jgi:hypothetical protein
VIIVENRAPEWTATSRWSIDTTPQLEIGSSEHDARYQFAGIRGVHRLPGGTIVVYDARQLERLRFYDRTGSYVHSTARAGAGPGEIPRGEPFGSFACGTDSVYVHLTRRVLVFTAAGEYVRQFSLVTADGEAIVQPAGCYGGAWLGLRHAMRIPTHDGRSRDSVSITWHDGAGRETAFAGMFPARDNNWSDVTTGNASFAAAPFGRTLALAAGPPGFAAGIGDVFEIATHDTIGALRRIVRARFVERALTADDADAFRAFALPRIVADPASVASLNASLSLNVLPRTIPAYAALLFDDGGNLWIREYEFADAVAFYGDAPRLGATRWWVIAPSGVLLGDIVLPPRFGPHEIGEDWMLGVWRDADDVEHVRVYRLRKPY